MWGTPMNLKKYLKMKFVEVQLISEVYETYNINIPSIGFREGVGFSIGIP